MIERRRAGKSQNVESRPIGQSDWTGSRKKGGNNRRGGERESEGENIDTDFTRPICERQNDNRNRDLSRHAVVSEFKKSFGLPDGHRSNER